MTAGRRNTTIVVALILSLTVGVRLLLWLEPKAPRWQSAPLLMAERGGVVEEIEVSYALTADRAEARVPERGDDGLCVVYADQRPRCWTGGPRVQVVVVGGDGSTLATPQKEWLLGVLGSLIQPTGLEHVRVRLARESDVLANPELPEPAKDLRKLLERKRIISEL